MASSGKNNMGISEIVGYGDCLEMYIQSISDINELYKIAPLRRRR